MDTGLIASKLEKARKLRYKVEKFVRSIRSSNAATKAVLAVSMADLSDPGSKRALVDFGPLVVHRLAVLAPATLIQYSISHELLDPYTDDSSNILVVLDNIGRRTQVVMEDFYEMDFSESLLPGISAIKKEIIAHLQADMTSELRNYGHEYPDVGYPVGRLDIEVNSLTFDRPDTFTIQGTFDVDMSSSVLVHSENDSDTDLLQSDAAAHRRFSVSFWPDAEDSTSADAGDPVIED